MNNRWLSYVVFAGSVAVIAGCGGGSGRSQEPGPSPLATVDYFNDSAFLWLEEDDIVVYSFGSDAILNNWRNDSYLDGVQQPGESVTGTWSLTGDVLTMGPADGVEMFTVASATPTELTIRQVDGDAHTGYKALAFVADEVQGSWVGDFGEAQWVFNGDHTGSYSGWEDSAFTWLIRRDGGLEIDQANGPLGAILFQQPSSTSSALQVVSIFGSGALISDLTLRRDTLVAGEQAAGGDAEAADLAYFIDNAFLWPEDDYIVVYSFGSDGTLSIWRNDQYLDGVQQPGEGATSNWFLTTGMLTLGLADGMEAFTVVSATSTELTIRQADGDVYTGYRALPFVADAMQGNWVGDFGEAQWIFNGDHTGSYSGWEDSAFTWLIRDDGGLQIAQTNGPLGAILFQQPNSTSGALQVVGIFGSGALISDLTLRRDTMLSE